jgi:PAS domain S-box-containing protein
MNQPPPPITASSSNRRLLGVNFVTFVLVALAFVWIVVYFRGVHARIFTDVEQATVEIAFSIELRRSLAKLEVDVQEFINQVLRKPEVLNREKARLLKEFQELNQRVAQNAKTEADRRLLASLTKYYGGLEGLLRDYTVLNEVLSRLRGHHELIAKRLNAMGKNTGRLMVEQAMVGHDTTGLQQLYLLVPLCQENFLHGRVLIDAGVLNNDPALLGASAKQPIEPPENTAAGKLLVLRQTLQTLTSADPSISGPAREVLADLPVYLGEIGALHDGLVVLDADWKQFEALRQDTMLLQEKMFAHLADNITSLKGLVVGHDQRQVLFTLLLSLLVFAVALTGFLLSRRLGVQLENMADQAIRTKDLAENANALLQIEIGERRLAEEALREAGEQLDQRVRERTAQLAAANRMLQEEIDIRFKAEEALAAEKERLVVTLRSIGEGVIATDHEGRVVMVNKVAEELTGWSQEAAISHPLAEVFPIRDRLSREPVADPLDRERRNGRVVPGQNLLLTRDGRERLIADSGAPIRDMESRVVGWVLVFRDISEQEKLEEELLKIRKLESVGILAGGIAHDFNNILAAILGNINLAMLYTDPDDRRHNLLASAEKASLRAKELTNQLLTFSKGGEPVKKITAIAEIIEDSAEFVLRGSKSKCRYLIPADLWAVEIDAGQISQVVQNIALNASQAMPEGGIIEIACANFDNRSRTIPVAADCLLRLTISDNGGGIAPEQVARIFDPYYTTKDEGSGLGLAITHSIITKHGGHISVASQPGVGTTFTIYLVAVADHGQADEQLVESRKFTGSGRILVLDDEEMVREVAREMLTHLGYEVLLAADGREAIDLYRQGRQEGRPIEVFLMDLTIPGGMGGQEAVAKLLALDPRVKAVVSSGYSNDPVVANFRDYGFVEVVAKPFRISDLGKVIAKVMTAKESESNPA